MSSSRRKLEVLTVNDLDIPTGDFTLAEVTKTVRLALEPTPNAVRIPIIKLRENPDNPREELDPQALDELAASMVETGQLQALVVRDSPSEPGFYTVIAGSRRLQAARRRPAELPVLECKIVDAAEHEAYAAAFVENFQRVNLTRRELLVGVARMNAEFGWSAREIGRRIGRDFSDIAEMLRVAADEGLFQLVKRGTIKPSAAGVLQQLPKPVRQEVVAQIEQGHPMPTVEHLRALKRRAAGVGIPTPTDPVATEGGRSDLDGPELKGLALSDTTQGMRPALITLNNLARQIESFCDRHGVASFNADEKEPLWRAWQRLGLLLGSSSDGGRCRR